MECAGTRTPMEGARNGLSAAPEGGGDRDLPLKLQPDRIEALRASEERYRTLFDLGPVAVYSCDAAGVIQEFNSRAAELWGRKPAVGDTDERFCGSFKLYRPDGSFMPHEQCPMAEVVSGKRAQVCDAEVLIERPDGSRVTVIVNIRPLRAAHGIVVGAINSFFDISARKRDEELLAAADRRKTEFLATLAHELRNPLATIRAGLQVQRLTGTDKPPGVSVTELMERQVGHLVGLVDDLLDVNRISQGKIQLQRRRVALTDVVAAAVETARSHFDRMGQEFAVAVPSEPIWMDADPLRLAQVLGNLLSNASKFTDCGGFILLRAILRGEEVEIRVTDNGKGIAAEHLPLVFDLFMQAEAPIEGAGTGLGIGLALVKSLVEMHQGTVEVLSDGVGLGSEFVVRLPTTRGAHEPRAAQRHQEPSVATSRRVLIVDDNRDAAESLAMVLQLGGHDTHIAHDGLQAVEMAAQLSPEIILLDIGLPKINGFEVARRIRMQPEGQRPVIVALSGWAQDIDRQKSRDSGFNAHIMKPVDPDVLANLLTDFPAVAASG